MAHISQETKNKIMTAIKREFPTASGWKITGRVDNYSSLIIAIRQAPIDLMEGMEGRNGHIQCGHRTSSEYRHHAVIARIDEIIRKEGEWFDKSDSMTDYFHVAFYYGINIGAWDKPFKVA